MNDAYELKKRIATLEAQVRELLETKTFTPTVTLLSQAIRDEEG